MSPDPPSQNFLISTPLLMPHSLFNTLAVRQTFSFSEQHSERSDVRAVIYFDRGILWVLSVIADHLIIPIKLFGSDVHKRIIKSEKGASE